ncbi:hypothetical protein [Haloglomus litoreum]|uniref:hypothetical protein n=1 Tax=Haloglomus litoreum TaxID=3034026 RepID=UPI0023E82312|nr:hypothetical protein [Haloglomus sp. DT116]
MSTKSLSSDPSPPTITNHAADQWEDRAPVDTPEPLVTAIHDAFEVDSQVNGDTAYYHPAYDLLLVIKSWRVVTVLYADHDRMDTTSMQACECGCLTDIFEHDACPRCGDPVEKTITMTGGWS